MDRGQGLRGRGGVVECKDGNGDPIPDSPWGFLPLGDVDGGELIPTGMELVELLSPSGMAGMGMVPWSPTPIPASPPREAAPSNRSSQGRKAHVRKDPLTPKYIYTRKTMLLD